MPSFGRGGVFQSLLRNKSRIRNIIAHNLFVFARDKNGRLSSGIMEAEEMKGGWPCGYDLLQVHEFEAAALEARGLQDELFGHN